MDHIDFAPTLDHCIKSRAREEFRNSVSRYLEGGSGDRDLGDRIELLKAFLEAADFGALPNQSEKHLIAGKSVKFEIQWRAEALEYQMMVIESI